MRVRPATPEDSTAIARVHVDSWKQAYADLVPKAHLAAQTYAHRAKQWAERLSNPDEESFTLVAESNSDGVIGFANAGAQRTNLEEFDGELNALYLLPKMQRRGIGRWLFEWVNQELRKRDLGSFVAWVLAENPARAFYEAMGGYVVGSQTVTIGGKDLQEVAYGWQQQLRASRAAAK